MGLCRRQLAFLLLLLPSAAIAQFEPAPTPAGPLTISEYIADLDRLASAAKQLAQPEDASELLKSVPAEWHIQTSGGTLVESSEWLRSDLNEWQRKPGREVQESIVTRLEMLRSEAAKYQDFATDSSQKRVLLNGILAGREFQNIHGPTWLDRLKQRVVELLIRWIGRIFKSSAIPTIGNVFVYGLIALALVAVGYWMYRTIRNSAGPESIVPGSLPVSNKGWKVWMKEARLAADNGNWRDAIHLGYWCGVSFLEAQGLWRADAARTPREYLRLLPDASKHRETLGTLTRNFELVWYGTQEADANAFAETLAQLEKLGCQSN